MKKLALMLSALIVGSAIVTNIGKPQVAGITADNKVVHGLIIPHHDLAANLITTAVESVAADNSYSTIVVLSPNHFHPDSYTITTTETLGDTTINTSIVQKLAHYDPNIVVDEKTVFAEHGVMVPIKYLKHFFPTANFIPVLLTPISQPGQIDKLATWLFSTSPADTLYVAAVDFAHNTTLLEGMKNNAETIDAIASFDYAKITTMTDDHIDSANAIKLLLKIMERSQTTTWQTLASSHGALITGNPALQGTSYVTGLF